MIRTVRTGRGLGVTDVPTVDLALFGMWHVLNERDQPLCLPKTRDPAQIERGVDAKVVVYRGKPVCARCRQRLGVVPMPKLVREENDGGGA